MGKRTGKTGQGTRAILCEEVTSVLISGTALGKIALMDKITNLDIIETGDLVTVNPEKGEVMVQKNNT